MSQKRYARITQRIGMILLCCVFFISGSMIPVQAEGSFISREAAERDLSAWFDMLETSFPLTDIADQRGEGLASMRESVHIPDTALRNPESYADFYRELCDRFTGDTLLAHFSPISPGIEYEYYYTTELRFASESEDDPGEDPWVQVFENRKAKGFYSWKGRPDLEEDSSELPDGDASGEALEENVLWTVDPVRDYALIQIRSFEYVNIEADAPEFDAFYREAKDVDHLIIDLRGNPGGVMQYWLKHLVQPNIRGTLSSTAYGPYKPSSWTKAIEEKIEESWGPSEDDDADFPGIRDTVQVMPGVMPGLDPSFSSSFQETIEVDPLNEEPLFKGKIWLLVDEDSYSSSESFAYFAKTTGFAVLVGQTKGGDGVSCIPVFTHLPESGLIFRYNLARGLNQDGTANADIGTTPDFLPDPDEDALELTLGMIQDEEKARGIAGLSTEQKEADYEAFWNILEDSYPMLDKLRDQGVDPEAIRAENAEAFQYIQDPYAWYQFYQSLINRMTGGQDLAHLECCPDGHIIFHGDYESYTYTREYMPDDPWVALYDPIFENPHVQGFYHLKPVHREEGDNPYIDMPYNLATELHPEADWAYVKIHSFLNQNPEDEQILRQFFQDAEASGISNIIIDVRGNLGGYNDYWLQKIIAPNITEALKVQNIGFYKDSDWNRHYIDYYAYENAEAFEEDALKEGGGSWPDMIFTWYKIPGSRVPAMPKLDKKIRHSLPLALAEEIQIQPSEKKPLFTGHFYLLTDGVSYSASEYFSSFCKRSGFATTVGQATAGDGACVLTVYQPLPHSGLIIRFNMLYGVNPDGSSSEERGTVPEYETEADALNYCLQLIKERS